MRELFQTVDDCYSAGQALKNPKILGVSLTRPAFASQFLTASKGATPFSTDFSKVSKTIFPSDTDIKTSNDLQVKAHAQGVTISADASQMLFDERQHLVEVIEMVHQITGFSRFESTNRGTNTHCIGLNRQALAPVWHGDHAVLTGHVSYLFNKLDVADLSSYENRRNIFHRMKQENVTTNAPQDIQVSQLPTLNISIFKGWRAHGNMFQSQKSFETTCFHRSPLDAQRTGYVSAAAFIM